MQTIKRLKQRGIVSLFSSYILQFGRQGLQFLSKIILARLLIPEDFGIYAIAFFIISIISQIRDCGLSTNIIRENENFEKKLFNILVFELTLSVVLILLVFLTAPLTSSFSTRLPMVLKIFILILLPACFSSFASNYFHKKLHIEKMVMPSISAGIIYILIAVILAKYNYGVWALVLAKLISEIILALYLMYKLKPYYTDIFKTLSGNLSDFLINIKPLLYKSRYFFAMAVFQILLIDIDKGLLGFFDSIKNTGYYFLAWSLVFLPCNIIEPAIYRVIYPMLSNLKHLPRHMEKSYEIITICLYAVEIPIYFMLAKFSYYIVLLAYGAKWIGAAEIVTALSFIPIILPHTQFGNELMKVKNKENILLLSSIAGTLILIIFGIILIKYFSIFGMVSARYISSITAIIIIIYIFNHFKISFFYITKKLFFIYLVNLLMLLFLPQKIISLFIFIFIAFFLSGIVIYKELKRVI